LSTEGRVCVAVGESVPHAVAMRAAFDAGACACVCLRVCVPASVRRRSAATVGGGAYNTAIGE
jgi:hypothetical protein